MKSHFEAELLSYLHQKSSFSEIDTSSFIPAGSLSLQEAFQVYREGYRARLTESLGEIYPAVWRALGDHEFFIVCAKYIESFPSQSYNLSLYGEVFVDFISDSWVSSLARLDLAFHQMFHSELKMPATLGFIELGAKAYSFWLSKDESEPKTEEIGKLGKQYILIYKNEHGIYSKEFSKFAFELLKLLHHGMKLEQAIEELDVNASEEDVRAAMEFIVGSKAVEVVS